MRLRRRKDSSETHDMRKIVVVNGFSRTGSTKCFYTAQCVLTELGSPFKSLGANLSAVDSAIEQHLADAQPEWLTIKTHRWMPRRSNEAVVVFYTTRDLADVARSFIALATRRKTYDGIRNGAETLELITNQEITWQALFNAYCAPVFSMVPIPYEKFYGADDAYVRKIASHMELTLSHTSVARIADKISVRRVKQETDSLTTPMDPVSQHRKFHISEALGAPNGSVDDLSPAIRALLKTFR
jgi:hypothetical protein